MLFENFNPAAEVKREKEKRRITALDCPHDFDLSPEQLLAANDESSLPNNTGHQAIIIIGI